MADDAGIRGLTGWVGYVLGAPDPMALARFYSRLFGWPIHREEPTWVVILVPGGRTNLAFQLEERFERPVWPAEPGKQQMTAHLDIAVSDLEAAVGDAVRLGATPAEFQPQEGVRVMLDPVGHPFCLYLDTA